MKTKILLLLALAATNYLISDEGMWPLNMLPKEQIFEKYNFQMNSDWVDHVQKSSLRISLGGSGSFVSKDGLVMTNHHVGSEAIYNLSTKDVDLIAEGFYAPTRDKELKCPNMYVDQLITIRDITDEINQALPENATPAEREVIRKEAIANISAKAQEKSGLQPEVVTLYQGARYHLYLYKRYSDVRLVMAPEKSIAYFGGDVENFEYPRHDFDVCFFRVYENGKPLKTDHYFSWSQSGPKTGELLFVSGHPGRTQRLYTSDHLRFLKNEELPLIVNYLTERIACLEHFSSQSAENRRVATQNLFSCQNGYKVFSSIQKGLSASSLIEEKTKSEEELYSKTAGFEKLKAALDGAKSYYKEFFVLEGRASRYSKLSAWAKHLVRWADEQAKPNDKRLEEYTESRLPSLELDLFSTEPVYINFESALLEDSFTRLSKILGANHPATLIVNSLVIEDMLKNSKLHDLEYRKELYRNPEKVKSSQDPFILLAKQLDPYSRALRKKKEKELDGIQKESYAQIAQLNFNRYGESIYPDATFTLRLSIGSMKGYHEGRAYIAPTTRLADAFKEASTHQFKSPYNLPKSWLQKEDSIKKSTPFNFVSTNDIIGGNSGSPVFNERGEIVGIIFDGNIHTMMWDLEFDETQGRAVSVHSEAIIDVLKNVYEAESLVKELRNDF